MLIARGAFVVLFREDTVVFRQMFPMVVLVLCSFIPTVIVSLYFLTSQTGS